MSKFSHRDHFFKCQEKQKLKRNLIAVRLDDHVIEWDKLRIKSAEDYLYHRIMQLLRDQYYEVTEEELKKEIEKIKSESGASYTG